MRRATRGFTLVELLVVIAIIGMLMALLLPAIQAARESGRRTACLNNIRQLALATVMYDDQFDRIPGLFEPLEASRIGETGSTGSGGELYTTWAVLLLPFLEKQKLADAYMGAGVPDKYVEVMLCPSDSAKQQSAAANSYAANGGRVGSSTLERTANGPFLNRVLNENAAMREGHWRDGADYTLTYAENSDAGRWDIAAWSGFGHPTYPPHRFPIDGDELSDDLVWSPVFLWSDDDTSRSIWNDFDIDTSDYLRINGRTARLSSKLECRMPSRLRFCSKCDEEYERLSTLNARAKSEHAEGVNVAFYSGRAVFVNESIDYNVWRALMTPNDEQSDSPFPDILLDDNDVP